MPNNIEIQYAKELWRYHCRLDSIEKIENTIILGLGSYDLRVASFCAELYLAGFGKKILFTGKSGNWTENLWDVTEAEIFSRHAQQLGVSSANIILEKEATNIGENIFNSKKIIDELSFKIEHIIIVTKPNTTRRAFATFMVHWPEMLFAVTAPDIKFDVLAEGLQIDALINEMVGDLERILIYPNKGFQIYQEVPSNVLYAYNQLKKAGYTKHCQIL